MTTDKPWIVGHRGARGLAPENTLASIDLAFSFGAQCVEIDVHPSADGVPVVHHDDTLERCTDAPRRMPHRAPWFVNDLTATELTTLDASEWFFEALHSPREHRPAPLNELSPQEEAELHFRASLTTIRPAGVPTLAQVLERIRARGAWLNIELKSIPRRYPGLVDAVLEEVSRHDMEENVILSSFDHPLLVRSKRLAPRIATGVLVSDRLFHPLDYVCDILGADVFLPGAHGSVDSLGMHRTGEERDEETAALVEQFHAREVRVIPWTVNQPSHSKRLLAIGVDGICTDFPNRLARLIAADRPA